MNIAPWFSRPRPNPRARIRLFCFPYAGGGVAAYRSWMSETLADCEMYFVQYPGRENRLSEPPLESIPTLLEALFPVLTPLLDRPFALFGHSLGALVAFELARKLRQEEQRSPSYLFVSACHAPQIPTRKEPTHHLPREAFIATLREFQGTPEIILQNQELMELLLPVLRADMAMYDTYTYQPALPLSCPILAFGGTEDKEVWQEELLPWREQTSAHFSLQMLPEGHFFLQSSRRMLLDSISQALYTPDL